MSEVIKKVGLLGGTFDPIHNGHIHVAEAVMQKAELDEVWFIPAGTPPHRNPPCFSAKDRFKMCELALQDKSKLIACDIEVYKTRPCYTIETIEALQKQHPNTKFYWIIGVDAFFNIESWHEYKKLLNEANFIVVNRDGFEQPKEISGKNVEFISIPAHDASATKIRDDFKDYKKDLSPAVLDYITQNKLL